MGGLGVAALVVYVFRTPTTTASTPSPPTTTASAVAPPAPSSSPMSIDDDRFFAVSDRMKDFQHTHRCITFFAMASSEVSLSVKNPAGVTTHDRPSTEVEHEFCPEGMLGDYALTLRPSNDEPYSLGALNCEAELVHP